MIQQGDTKHQFAMAKVDTNYTPRGQTILDAEWICSILKQHGMAHLLQL